MKKPVTKKQEHVTYADAVVVTADPAPAPYTPTHTDDAGSSVDDEPFAAPAPPAPAQVDAPVVVRKLVLGAAPNPSLEEMNKAHVAAYAQKTDESFAAAQRALARMFKKRGGNLK